MKFFLKYRTWWRWDGEGSRYRIVADSLATTPDLRWHDAGTHDTVLRALEAIGRMRASMSLPYVIEIVPDPVREPQKPAPTQRDIEARGVAAMRAIEDGDDNPYPRSGGRCPDCGEYGERKGHMECQFPQN